VGEVALITGAGSGIGRELTMQMSRQGEQILKDKWKIKLFVSLCP
jgi:NAD(P)-dependent dehydrogenase (short-subunit alcohol dehydrogenase family)